MDPVVFVSSGIQSMHDYCVKVIMLFVVATLIKIRTFRCQLTCIRQAINKLLKMADEENDCHAISLSAMR